MPKKKIIIRSVAGLANQMHQYAFGRALSIANDAELFLDTDPFYYDTRSYALDVFNIQAKIASNNERPWYLKLFKNKTLDMLRYPISFICKKLDPHYLIENPSHPKVHQAMFDYNPHIKEKVATTHHDVYLEGFWHSEKYFAGYEDNIKKDFTLKQPINDPKNLHTIEVMRQTNSISIHVRRSDYISLGYKLCDISYYNDAIVYIKNKVDKPVFFIFSDDLAWCQDAFKEHNFEHFIDWNAGKDSYKDMILMAKCKHNIIANSTFSRRGARLNEHPDKIVIAPAQRHHTIDYADIIPSSRIRI